jgi:hypothetical protein
MHSSPYFQFDHSTNKNMEDSSYDYFHCDLLDMRALITITLQIRTWKIQVMIISIVIC